MMAGVGPKFKKALLTFCIMFGDKQMKRDCVLYVFLFVQIKEMKHQIK
jgi:hypothetical protein